MTPESKRELPPGLHRVESPAEVESEIRRLYALATKPGPITERDGIGYREVTGEQAGVYRKRKGPDVTGYEHVIDNYGIRHADNEHGHAMTEEPRGQLPVTVDDFAAVPTITVAENLVVVESNRRDLTTLKYGKRVNGYLLVVEEVQTGRRILAFASLRKYKAEKNAPTTSARKGRSQLRYPSLPTPDDTPSNELRKSFLDDLLEWFGLEGA